MRRRYVPLAFVLATGLAAAPAGAQSMNPVFRAHTWANDGSAASYTPNAAYTFNPAGGVTITRSSVGRYTVTFAGLAGLGPTAVPFVTAYGALALCRIEGWAPVGADLLVGVYCDTLAGTAVDARYDVSVVSAPAGTAGVGYVWNGTAGASSTPTAWVYNAGGGSTTIDRTAPGRYAVTFNGLTSPVGGGHVQVSPYGPSSNGVACVSPSRSSAGSTVVNVECRNGGGLVDSPFTLLFLPTNSTTPGLGFAMADQQTAASYTPSAFYSYNGGGGAISATRSAAGTYTMDFAGLTILAGGNVQVTAMTSARYCYAGGWAVTQINVSCVDMTGAASDARYHVLFTHPEIVVAAEDGPDVGGVVLRAPVPNPAAGAATLAFTLDRPMAVRLAVYDALGREVAVLADGMRAAGTHEAGWDAGGVPAGAYVARLTAGGATRTQPLAVVR